MQPIHLASLLTLGIALTSIPVMPSYAQEAKIQTFYELQNQQVKVTYSTSSITGEAVFKYEDSEQKLLFSGTEIQTEDTAIGKLVTVTVKKTVDTGYETFSLLLPDVNLKNSSEAKIVTQGIKTINRLSTIPLLNEGQRQIYTTITPLLGTAKALTF
ncbi:hypothetical protein H6G76_15400 [Nostoc sp. FACHB-152]|uniref:hypothetical protein n=1 Tax=unclassified Nostoc TaxID=2593658 RepID=UPI001687D6D7|nr:MULTISPECIES: hypothetical protein [unclassified Nostoc]MBD2448517.1 hypothetical protein [Nostoc sp. FACHB-152]MBD2466254.1 hypothetical protein [Nostoc sp. FACHB-145]